MLRNTRRLAVSLAVLAILAGLTLTTAPVAHAAPAAPADTVTAYHDHLIESVSAASGDTDRKRFTLLAPAMDTAFDFESMIKTAAGRYWQQADAAARRDLLDAFRNVSIATHADQFAGMTDGAFTIHGTRDGPRGLKLVDSELKTGDETVALSYVLRIKDGQWRIIDVLLKGGISELALRASEYASTLKQGGAAALTRSLNDRTAALLEN